jgi:enoyl-CoA hydratase/carnithine racemase
LYANYRRGSSKGRAIGAESEHDDAARAQDFGLGLENEGTSTQLLTRQFARRNGYSLNQICDADSQTRQSDLLRWRENVVSEPPGVEQLPKPVARAGEVQSRFARQFARVDATEEHTEVRSDQIRDAETNTFSSVPKRSAHVAWREQAIWSVTAVSLMRSPPRRSLSARRPSRIGAVGARSVTLLHIVDNLPDLCQRVGVGYRTAKQKGKRLRPDFDSYSTRYEHVAMERSDEGVIEVRLHSNGGPLVWGASPHSELGFAFADVGSDPGNRVVIITGTGDEFIKKLDDKIFTDGKRLLQNLLAIEVPVVGVVNGPATVHAELAVLSDIVIAADHAYFSDAPHFRYGTIPSDGVHVVWPMILGPNRGRYFLLTGQRIGAEEAKALGVVSEVLTAIEVRARGHELARLLAKQRDSTLRYTREAFMHSIRQAMANQIGFGLALEGLGAYDSWPET